MRQVTPKLWIGNALEARDLSGVLDAGIESIVDLAVEEPAVQATRELVCCRVPIVDGGGNLPGRIRLAIEVVCSLTSADVPTLVACSAGMSRSPAIVAAALSRVNGTTLSEALLQLADIGPIDVSPALLGDVVAVLEQNID